MDKEITVCEDGVRGNRAFSASGPAEEKEMDGGEILNAPQWTNRNEVIVI